MAASPTLAGEKLLMSCDQTNDSYLLAVDKNHGHPLWKTERPEVTHGFSTPILYRPTSGPTQVIVPGCYQLIAYSVDTGEKLWWVRGLTWQVKSMPVIAGNILYFNGWAPGGDSGEQADLPGFQEVITKCDKNHDGMLGKEELPKEWQPTGSWEAIDLDRDGLLNERDWNFFRARRAAQNSLIAVRLGGKGDVTDSNLLCRYSNTLPDVPSPFADNVLSYL